MKKRLLSALLALALVFVLLPTTALAGVTTGDDYDISINGRGWKFEKDTTSGAYIPVYYYHTGVFDNANNKNRTNDNLELTKKDNTVTITIRRGTSHDHGNYSPITFTLKKESTKKNDVPCIEMGNGNNLVITGKGTLNITRNENKSYGAALYSNVGDITINGGITVNVSFLNGKDYYNKNVSSNAIYVGDNHNLTVSGSGTNVIATNQGFHSSPATVCVEGGTITVSGGASLSATNTYDDNRSGSDDVKIQHFNSYAISGTKSNPCTLIVADEKSSVTATTNDFTNIAESWAFKYTTIQAAGATIKAGSSVSNSTVTTIDNISGQRYAKISIPALETTADVLIAKENAVVGVRTSLGEGNGYYTYNKDTKTLTLEDVSITNVAHFIQFWAKDSYTIELKGTNTITGVTSAIRVPEKGYNNESLDGLNVTITGTGSLNVTANTYAIDMQVGNLIFNSTGNITLTTNTNYLVQATVRNALHVAGKITIDKAKYDIVGVKQDKDGTREDISDNPNLDTILKGTSTEKDLYFKSITITPAAAKDSTISYNRKTLKQGGIITGENGGTATVDSKNNTITLDNFKGNYPLEFNAEFTPNSITLIGDSTLSAVETKYQNLTISGSGSLTVGSIKVHNQKASSDDKPNLTINGATVTVGTAELTTRAIDIDGDLTVTNGSLTATSKSDNVPTVQVGGNASFTGSTVTITNNSTTQGKSGEYSYEVSTGLYVGGTLDIKNAAKVTSTVIGGNAIYAKGDITISGDNTEVKATNDAYKFSAISTNKTVNISDNSTVKAENLKKHQGDPTGETDPSTGKTYNACPAITGKIANKNTQNKLHIEGFTTSNAGSQNPTEETPLNLDIAPGSVEPYILHYNVTITRGDAYTTPQVAANYTIAGQTMYVGKYYKTDTNGNITDGTAQDYNIYCDSENDFTLNNATISSTGTGGSTGVIKTNLDYSSAQFHIKLIGTNSINNAGHHAILGEGAYSTIIIENAENASNASLTISGNYLPVYSYGNVTINAEVVIINTNGNLISTNKDGHANGAFDLGSGYKCYASASTTGNPLEEFNSANYGTYKYLRVTTQTPETGGGSTHQHVFSTSWESNADYHWHKCTVQGCTEVSDKEAHVYTNTWWKNSNGNHGRTCDKCRHEGEIHEFRKYYDFADETYHVERCGYLNCTYVGRQETHSYDSFGVCKCGYSPNGLPAPPSLQGVAPTSENGTDGKILNSNIGMEYAQNLNGPWTKWNEHSNITGLSAGTYYVRYTKTDERFPDNQVATVEVPAYTPGGDPTPDIPAAPTGLVGVAPTSENGNGKITGTTAQMEYASSLEGDWTACANDSTDVPAGKYYVRMKKTDNTPAGEAVEVTVPAYSGTGEIVPPTPDNPGTIVIIRPAEEEKPAQQPNPSTGANDLVGLAVAAAVAAALGSAALLRKHD